MLGVAPESSGRVVLTIAKMRKKKKKRLTKRMNDTTHAATDDEMDFTEPTAPLTHPR